MAFRPLPILTVATLIILGVLIYLGVWQYQRAEWKSDEIASYLTRLEAPETDLETALCQGDALEGAPVSVSLPFSPQIIRVYGFALDGTAGWHRYGLVSPPSCLPEESRILIELDFESFQTGDFASIERRRVDRFATRKAMFTPLNVPAKNEWYWLDADAIDAYLFPAGEGRISRDWIIVADDGLPPHLKKTPPGRHIGYSVTWFGLAIGLLVMYAAFHVHAGRLRFGGKD